MLHVDTATIVVFRIAFVLIGLFLLKILYTKKSPTILPAQKPKLSWLPKYKFMLDSSTNEAIVIERMNTVGLYQQKDRKEQLVFSTRGSQFGDLFIKNCQVDACLKQNNCITVEYRLFAGCLFDTGGLWTFTSKLKDALETEPTATKLLPCV